MCQLPSCNLFTQHYIVLWRDTASKLWTPVLLFNLAIQSTSYFTVFLLQTILFPFDTINPLFSARPVRLTTSLSSWGRVIWLCCEGLYFNLGVILVSCWFDNLGFILREILAAVYIITLLLGRPTKGSEEFLAPHQHSVHQEIVAPLSGIINSAPSKDIIDHNGYSGIVIVCITGVSDHQV